MKRAVVTLWLGLSVAVCAADEVEKVAVSSAPASTAAAAPASAAPAAAPVSAPAPELHSASITRSAAEAGDKPVAEGGPAPARFETDAQWKIAGYNNEEIIYTILVTSHDSRIIRCNTELKGSYYENGQKLSVADRQISTVFPDQQVQVGNWMGMDEKSGATYSVKCHAI
jgi:hypothetical protein